VPKLTRYEENFSPWGAVEEAEDGDYVRYDAVQAELTRLRSVEQAARVILQCFDDSCEASCVASDAEIEALRLALDSK
jgi:predicted double-glycine peptidase